MTLKEIRILHATKIETIYGRTFAGKIWIALKPMIQLVFMGFVFGKIITINQENHTAFIMYGFLLLNFITASLSSASGTISENIFITSRFNVSKNFFSVVNIYYNLYICFISFIPCALLVAIFTNLPIHLNMIFAPFYLIYIVTTMFLVCASIAIIYPYFQDIKFLIEVTSMVSLWVTPIFYPMSQMPGWMFKLSYFNPFFILIAPFVRLMHEGLLPTMSMHISMLGLFVVSLLIYIITQKKLSRNVIYYC